MLVLKYINVLGSQIIPKPQIAQYYDGPTLPGSMKASPLPQMARSTAYVVVAPGGSGKLAAGVGRGFKTFQDKKQARTGGFQQ